MTYVTNTILVDLVSGERVKIIDYLIQRDHRELYVIQTETGQVKRMYLPTLERQYGPDNVVHIDFNRRTIKRKAA